MFGFSEFIGKYPVARTLRFELRPQEATEKFLDITQDFLRAEQ